MTIVIEFIVGVYVFPLAIELVLVPVPLLLVLMQAYAARTRTDRLTRKAFDGTIGTVGLFLLVYVVIRLVADAGSVLTRENVENLVAVPALTLAPRWLLSVGPVTAIRTSCVSRA